MRKLKKISAVLLATALFANPCLGSQYLQDVHAEETAGEESAIAQETQTEAEKAEAEKTAGENGGYTEKEQDELPEEYFQDTTEKDVISESTETESSDPDDELSTAALSAESQQITVDLYFIYDVYKDELSLPDGYKRTYQIVLPDGITGNVQYKVDGDSATVDKNGIISASQEATGQSTVHVTCGDYTQIITVNVNSYVDMYVDDTLDKIYSEITSGKELTQAELAEEFTKYASEHFDYSGSCSSLSGIIIYKAGSCWANTSFINALCTKAGIESKTRKAAHDSGAGSGHINSIIKADGKYYVADAGFSGKSPRGYSFKEEPNGLSMIYSVDRNWNSLTQYDAFETEAVIPETVNGNTINTLCYYDYINDCELSGVFANGVAVTSVSLPKTITYISPLAFQGCESLSRISVDKENTKYIDIDGILYAKDGTVVRVPQTMTDVTLSNSTTAIGDFAFSGNKVKEITIPDGVTSIGFAAFHSSSVEVITIPASVTTIKDNAFGYLYDVIIKGTKGSYVEQYAADNGLIFVDIETGDVDRKYIEEEMARIRREIDSYSEENLKSSDKTAIEKLIADIGILSTHRRLTQEERNELTELRVCGQKYLDQITKVTEEIKILTKTVNEYMAENPESLNKEYVKGTSARIAALLNTKNLTDEERATLTNLKSQCDKLVDLEKNNIEKLIAEIQKKISSYSEENVKSSDKSAIEELITEIDALSLFLTGKETELEKLSKSKAEGEKYLARIAKVAKDINTLTDTVNGYIAENPESLNKKDVKQTSDGIAALLNTENLTDEERTTLSTLQSQCGEFLKITVEKGDINKNGKVDLTDLMLCLNHVAKKNILKDEAFVAADVDENGTVNLADLMRILNYISKKNMEI